jgi:hypothetical protein
VFWFRLSYREGSARGRLVARLAMGMAIPRDAGGWASGMAAVRKGRMAREKECERYISDRKSWVSKRAEEDWRPLGPWGMC